MKLKEEKGFTLVEIIVVIVILVILGMFTFSFLNHVTTIYVMGSKQRVIYQEASYIMERLTRELRDAQTVSAGTETLTITKVHVVGSMDSSTSITFSRDMNGNMLRRSGGVDRIMGKNVNAFLPTLTACTGGSSNCMVIITLQLTDPNIPINDISARSVTMTTTVSPKNIIPSTGTYSGRCFNGDYEDVIQ